MSICKTCRNYDVCKFDFKDTVNTCSFIYPEEIPLIHGKAELELHDKEISNKAIDKYANALSEHCRQSGNKICNECPFCTGVVCEIINIAERMKDGY